MQHKKKTSLDWILTKRLLAYLLPYKIPLFATILFLLFSKGIESFVPVYIGYLVEMILKSFSLDASKKLGLLQVINVHGFRIVFLLLLAYFFEFLNTIIKNWIGQKGLFQLRQDIFSHIQKMPVEFFNQTPVGTLMTRTIHDVEQINQMFSESVVPLIGSLLLFVGISISLSIMDVRAAVVLFCVLPFVFLLANFFRYHQRRCYDLIRGIIAALNAFVQEHLMGAMTIRSFGLQKVEKKKFDELNCAHRNANVEAIHYFAAFFAGIDFLQSFALISVFVVLAYVGKNAGHFEAGSYFTFNLYVIMLFRPLADLAERYNLLQSAFAAADRIFKLLDLKTEKISDRKKVPTQAIESIEFDNVFFAYRKQNLVLKGFNFTIQKGESIALVGLTGAGKTTILNLLLRFYDTSDGSIKINGIDIQNYPLHQLRNRFSVVLQDPEIFSGTIRDNITLGEKIPDETVQKAIDYVHLRPFIDTLPEGLDHYLKERGKSISLGQRQLLSLARAVAFDREVLLLDEATANIDSSTEKILQEVLNKFLAEKTSIVIAHRLSTIQHVDKIIVVHDGVAKEIGTHAELLKQRGIYEKLYRLQFSSDYLNFL